MIDEKEFNKVFEKLKDMVDNLNKKIVTFSNKRSAALAKDRYLQVHLLDVKIDLTLEKCQLLEKVLDMLASPEMYNVEVSPKKTVLPVKKKVYTAADGTKWVEDPLSSFFFRSLLPGGVGVNGELFQPVPGWAHSNSYDYSGLCCYYPGKIRAYRQVFKTKKVKKGK